MFACTHRPALKHSSLVLVFVAACSELAAPESDGRGVAGAEAVASHAAYLSGDGPSLAPTRVESDLFSLLPPDTILPPKLSTLSELPTNELNTMQAPQPRPKPEQKPQAQQRSVTRLLQPPPQPSEALDASVMD